MIPDEFTRPCVLDCRPDNPRPAVPAWRVCGACVNRLAWMLHDIPELFALLDDVIEPGAAGLDGGRRAPGFASRAPAREDAIALRDRRTVAVEEDDPHSVLDLLASWADNVRDDLGEPPARPPITVAGEARVLSRNLGHIAAQDWVVDFADEISTAHRHLRRVTGDHDRILDLGACPGSRIDEHNGNTRLCGARLRARLDEEETSCRRCGATWPRQAWYRLATTSNPERLTAFGIDHEQTA